MAKIDICNGALDNLGRDPVTALSEVALLSETYENVRKFLLESHPWNFALKRAALNEQSTEPLFGWENQYTLPSDFIRLVQTEEEEENAPVGDPFYNGHLTVSFKSAFAMTDDYRIEDSTEGKILLSHDDIKNIIYVFDQQDTTRFSPTFRLLLEKGISAKRAYKITGSKTLAQSEQEEFERMFRLATTVDGQQSKIRPILNSSFLSSRY